MWVYFLGQRLSLKILQNGCAYHLERNVWFYTANTWLRAIIGSYWRSSKIPIIHCRNTACQHKNLPLVSAGAAAASSCDRSPLPLTPPTVVLFVMLFTAGLHWRFRQLLTETGKIEEHYSRFQESKVVLSEEASSRCLKVRGHRCGSSWSNDASALIHHCNRAAASFRTPNITQTTTGKEKQKLHNNDIIKFSLRSCWKTRREEFLWLSWPRDTW